MGSNHRVWLIALLMSWQAYALAAGEPGQLDPEFNGSGVAVHEVGGEVTSQVGKVFVVDSAPYCRWLSRRQFR